MPEGSRGPSLTPAKSDVAPSPVPHMAEYGLTKEEDLFSLSGRRLLEHVFP